MLFENLRPPQKKAVELLRSDWIPNGLNRHVLSASVAFGKTAFAAYITRSFNERKKRVLFIAPYTVLVEQTAQRFNEYGLTDIGIVWRDHPDFHPHRMIQIASADTLIRREWPDNIDLVIVDECHIRRKALIEIFAEIDTPVIGLSGTPYAKWMGNTYNNLVKPTTMAKLISQGWLSKYEFYAPTTPNMEGAKTSNQASFGNDYTNKDAFGAMNKAMIYGDIVENWLERGQNRQTIAFCVNVDHAKQLTIEFNKLGVPCEIMTAKTKHFERQEIFKRFREGVTKIICNVGVLVAGFDEDVRCIIYARPTKSEIRWVQCLGRGLRSADGKDYCLIFDHSGTVMKLGFPDQIEYNELLTLSSGLESNDTPEGEKEKLEKLPKECPKCRYIKPAGHPPRCPKCGFMPLRGEDVPTDRKARLKKITQNIEKARPPTEREKQIFYAELNGYRKKMNNQGKKYSEKWCDHKYRKKFGIWPRKIDKREFREPSLETENFIKYQNIKYARGKQKYGNA